MGKDWTLHSGNVAEMHKTTKSDSGDIELLVTIALITVEPADQRFTHESEAFRKSF